MLVESELVTLEQARGSIQNVLYVGRSAQAYRQWVAELRERARVRVDEAALAGVRPGATPGAPPGSAAAFRN